MTDKQRILLCGDVEGRFDILYEKVETIFKRFGSFDTLLCVGNFFGVNNKEFIPYRLGDKKVPIPTYILGPNKEEHVNQYPSDDSKFELCNNVYYLGKRGVYTDSKGLKIAYLSGIFENNIEKPWTYTDKDVSDLCDICVRGNPTFRGVDILLTSQWPEGILTDNSEISLSVNAVSNRPSYLCMKLKPRYLVSGLEGVYYKRPPFRCPNLGDHDTTLDSATHFIGLLGGISSNKGKWIYALKLTPLDKMKISHLVQKTTDETPCPFDFRELESKIFGIKRKHSEVNQYFYDMGPPAAVGKNKKKFKKPRTEMDHSNCWFCLASVSVEKHLIISVGNAAYLALAKGGIVEEHFLICPIEHYQNSLNQPPEVLEEINQFKEALKKFYLRNGQVPVFFERNYKTSHMQLQAIPIPSNADKELKDIFIDESEAQGFKLEVLESHNRLDQVIPQKVPYFVVELPNGTTLYTKIPSAVNFPLNFAREVLSMGPILNLPDRVEWKECVLSKAEEEKLVQRLRADFGPFDFTA